MGLENRIERLEKALEAHRSEGHFIHIVECLESCPPNCEHMAKACGNPLCTGLILVRERSEANEQPEPRPTEESQAKLSRRIVLMDEAGNVTDP